MQIVPKAPLFPMQATEKGVSGSQISPGGKRSQVYLSKISMYNIILLNFIFWVPHYIWTPTFTFQYWASFLLDFFLLPSLCL